MSTTTATTLVATIVNDAKLAVDNYTIDTTATTEAVALYTPAAASFATTAPNATNAIINYDNMVKAAPLFAQRYADVTAVLTARPTLTNFNIAVTRANNVTAAYNSLLALYPTGIPSTITSQISTSLTNVNTAKTASAAKITALTAIQTDYSPAAPAGSKMAALNTGLTTVKDWVYNSIIGYFLPRINPGSTPNYAYNINGQAELSKTLQPTIYTSDLNTLQNVVLPKQKTYTDAANSAWNGTVLPRLANNESNYNTYVSLLYIGKTNPLYTATIQAGWDAQVKVYQDFKLYANTTVKDNLDLINSIFNEVNAVIQEGIVNEPIINEITGSLQTINSSILNLFADINNRVNEIAVPTTVNGNNLTDARNEVQIIQNRIAQLSGIRTEHVNARAGILAAVDAVNAKFEPVKSGKFNNPAVSNVQSSINATTASIDTTATPVLTAIDTKMAGGQTILSVAQQNEAQLSKYAQLDESLDALQPIKTDADVIIADLANVTVPAVVATTSTNALYEQMQINDNLDRINSVATAWSEFTTRAQPLLTAAGTLMQEIQAFRSVLSNNNGDIHPLWADHLARYASMYVNVSDIAANIETKKQTLQTNKVVAQENVTRVQRLENEARTLATAWTAVSDAGARLQVNMRGDNMIPASVQSAANMTISTTATGQAIQKSVVANAIINANTMMTTFNSWNNTLTSAITTIENNQGAVQSDSAKAQATSQFLTSARNMKTALESNRVALQQIIDTLQAKCTVLRCTETPAPAPPAPAPGTPAPAPVTSFPNVTAARTAAVSALATANAQNAIAKTALDTATTILNTVKSRARLALTNATTAATAATAAATSATRATTTASADRFVNDAKTRSETAAAQLNAVRSILSNIAVTRASIQTQITRATAAVTAAQAAATTAGNAAKVATDNTTKGNASNALVAANAARARLTSTIAVLTALNTWVGQANTRTTGWITQVQAKATAAQSSYTTARNSPKATKTNRATSTLHSAASNDDSNDDSNDGSGEASGDAMLKPASCMREYNEYSHMHHSGMMGAVIVIVLVLCLIFYFSHK